MKIYLDIVRRIRYNLIIKIHLEEIRQHSTERRPHLCDLVKNTTISAPSLWRDYTNMATTALIPRDTVNIMSQALRGLEHISAEVVAVPVPREASWGDAVAADLDLRDDGEAHRCLGAAT